jgi:hypothetical protein
MKIGLDALRLSPALYRCLTAIGLAALLVGLMVASKGGGVWTIKDAANWGGLTFLVAMQPNPFSIKMDDLPIDALDLGRIGPLTKQRAELVEAFVDVYAGLAHAAP